jgi:hypothetical protein
VMGTCILFAHLSSNFYVPAELDLNLCENVLTECVERFQSRCFKIEVIK